MIKLCVIMYYRYEPRREEFSLSCTPRVSRYVTILLIGELLCFFFCEVKKLCKRTLNVREIHYKLISKVVLYIFYLELNLLFVFLLCSINVKLFIYQFLFSKCFR